MSKQQYKQLLAWSLERGLELDSRIERKKVNGVYGMYAKAPIPQNTVIARFPRDQLIPDKKDIVYADDAPECIGTIHTAAIELSKGNRSDFLGCISQFETIEELRSHSYYFFTDQELQLLGKLNPILHRITLEEINRMNHVKERIQLVDPDLNEDFIIQTMLNYYSRGWNKIGFVPVLDLFNHSDRKGGGLLTEKDNLIHKTLVAYEQGEEVLISYSRKDMIYHALHYNYFDPSGVHFIDFGLRALQVVRTELRQKVLDIIANKYRCFCFEVNGVRHFRVRDAGLFFLENAPNLKLIEYFQDSSFQSESEISEGKCSSKAILQSLLSIIDPFLGANQVENYKLSDFPEKLHRFYHMLKKERQMLLSNRCWVFDNL